MNPTNHINKPTSHQVKCDGLFPCSRCWDRVCFCCRPQMDGFIEAGADEGNNNSSRLSSPSSAASAASTGGGGAAAASGQLTTAPYIHLVFLRSHPQASAEGFLAAFMPLHAQGRIDRGKLVRVL